VAPTELWPGRHGIFSLEDSLPSMFMRNAECSRGTNTRGFEPCYDTHYVSPRLSALSPSNWRTQRAVVHSISRSTNPSTVSMGTGLTTSPTGGLPSQFIPRSSSIIFHPTEMLYGVGSLDGTGTYSIFRDNNLFREDMIVRIYGSKLM
jgi:hypothetical protein